NLCFSMGHAHLPVHEHWQEPVAEFGEFLGLLSVGYDFCKHWLDYLLEFCKNLFVIRNSEIRYRATGVKYYRASCVAFNGFCYVLITKDRKYTSVRYLACFIVDMTQTARYRAI